MTCVLRVTGEDAAFCSALAKYLAPLGRIEKAYYRCWSYAGSHVDKFLANTRLANNQDRFEFVVLGIDQQPGGALEQAIEKYSRNVSSNLPNTCRRAGNAQVDGVFMRRIRQLY
ncbi:MAG: hypothetical protein HT580_10365 [Dechloromonas sp.]|nr:MAG: hypothetical protein HT580_10365 [Dechloromonas sp.]